MEATNTEFNLGDGSLQSSLLTSYISSSSENVLHPDQGTSIASPSSPGTSITLLSSQGTGVTSYISAHQGDVMAPVRPLHRGESLSQSSVDVPEDARDDGGLCNEGFQEDPRREKSLNFEGDSSEPEEVHDEERVPRADTAYDQRAKEIAVQPPTTPLNKESPLNGAPGSGANTFGHSRGASTDASTIDASYTPSVTESRRGTYSESGTLPVGALHEGTPVVEENGGLKLKNGHITPPAMEKEFLKEQPGTWKSVKKGVHNFSRPLMRKHYAISSEPSKGEKLKYAFTCPPHGEFGTILTWILFLVLFYGSLVYITHEHALPGGSLFSLFILVIFAQLGGMIVAKLTLPPLLGMLIVGIMFRSVPVLDTVGASIEPMWSSSLRSTALVVILIRAGLGLDPKALKKLSFVVVRLSCMPCLTETVTVAIVSHFLLGFPWSWGFMLGFVLAAVSPAVVVPCLLNLQEQGWGVEKGIPTLVIAAASIDDVIAISGFGVSLGMTFSTGSAVWQGLKGPIEVFMGIGYGIIFGVILWILPNRKRENATMWRFLILFLAGLLAVFGSKGIHFDGAGALAALCVAFVAGIGYRNKPSAVAGTEVKDYFNYMWMFFQPMLFGLIGTEIQVTALDPETIGWGIITLLVGLSFRVIVSFFAVMNGGLTMKERFFVALAWLPKATVQAAIGSTALDYARLSDGDPLHETEAEIMGKKVLTIAVLVILLTAPVGAIAIMMTAPKLLKKAPSKTQSTNSSA